MYNRKLNIHLSKGLMEKENVKLFHNNEIAFCGYSGSGKTTLISRLTQLMEHKLKIGYVKHDAHRFEMDHEGKDTWQLQKSGARKVLINDSNHWAVISKIPMKPEDTTDLFTDMDIVFVEGYKNSSIPKFILIDKEKTILEDLKNSQFQNVIGLIGKEDILEYPSQNVPYFHRDDLDSIWQHLYRNINS